jgi:hypothetical protein
MPKFGFPAAFSVTLYAFPEKGADFPIRKLVCGDFRLAIWTDALVPVVEVIRQFSQRRPAFDFFGVKLSVLGELNPVFLRPVVVFGLGDSEFLDS